MISARMPIDTAFEVVYIIFCDLLYNFCFKLGKNL